MWPSLPMYSSKAATLWLPTFCKWNTGFWCVDLGWHRFRNSPTSGYPLQKALGFTDFWAPNLSQLSLPWKIDMHVALLLKAWWRFLWTRRTSVVILIQHHNRFSWLCKKTTQSKRNTCVKVFDFLRIFCLNNHGCLSPSSRYVRTGLCGKYFHTIFHVFFF